jgi:alcohol dehydrogenase (NADP+)
MFKLQGRVAAVLQRRTRIDLQQLREGRQDNHPRGYSTKIVVDEDYLLRIPAKLSLEKVAPLLCAGITTYSPLRYWKVGRRHKLAVLGLGGLGHMAVKFGSAFGAKVTVLSSSAAKRLGAHDFVVTRDDEK